MDALRVPRNLLHAQFLERPNRFLVYAKMNNARVACFLPNPGRLRELLTPDAELLLHPRKASHRKTAYDVFGLVRNEKIVPLDTRLTNKIVIEALEKKRLPEFSQYDSIQPEFKFGHSRFDFKLASKHRECLLEVKCCTLIEDGVALFPDAPTERGTRHLLDLIRARKRGYYSAILFMIQNHGAKIFMPNASTDNAFTSTLLEASRRGVEVIARKTLISQHSIMPDERVRVSFDFQKQKN